MKRTFVELPIFRAKWKALGLNEDDLKRLQEEMLLDPKIGAVMKETGGVRKMRFAYEHRGKSGSIRVIYIDFEVYEKIYLLTAYPKNEKDNLSKAERNELRELVQVLEHQLEEREGKTIVSVFDDIKTGLNQAIEYEKGNLKANAKTISVTPLEEFTANEIKNIRKNAGLTQSLFARYLGVSLKTVEAWESGRNQPNGSACRMLSITKNDPQFPKKSGIIV